MFLFQGSPRQQSKRPMSVDSPTSVDVSFASMALPKKARCQPMDRMPASDEVSSISTSPITAAAQYLLTQTANSLSLPPVFLDRWHKVVLYLYRLPAAEGIIESTDCTASSYASGNQAYRSRFVVKQKTATQYTRITGALMSAPESDQNERVEGTDFLVAECRRIRSLLQSDGGGCGKVLSNLPSCFLFPRCLPFRIFTSL